MKKLNGKLEEVGFDSEKKWAFIFAVITVVAIIVELFFNGINGASVSGAVKDIFGTLIDVAVLFIAIKALMPKKQEPFDFGSELDKKIQEWQSAHDNMVLPTRDRDLFMKTDVDNFFNPGSSELKGRFVSINEISDKNELQLTFSLNKSLFVGHGVEESETKKILDDVFNNKILPFAQKNFKNVKPQKSNYNIVITLDNLKKAPEEIEFVGTILETMYQAFVVCATTRK